MKLHPDEPDQPEEPSSRMQEAARVLDIDDDALALRCGMSRSTYYRRKRGKGDYTPRELDLLSRHAAAFTHAQAVFQSDEEARDWLMAPQYGLGGAVPIDLLQTTAGYREVEKLLTRIDFGVYA